MDLRHNPDRLKAHARKADGTYRLLTEAEWEYTCRAGSTSAYYFGDSACRLGEYAWYRDNSGATTHPVGQKMPNAFGLYDMHGNAWEWCQDWNALLYPSAPQTDPLGPASGDRRVVRGGVWNSIAAGCRSALRGRNAPGYRGFNLGLRLASTTPKGRTVLSHPRGPVSRSGRDRT